MNSIVITGAGCMDFIWDVPGEFRLMALNSSHPGVQFNSIIRWEGRIPLMLAGNPSSKYLQYHFVWYVRGIIRC